MAKTCAATLAWATQRASAAVSPGAGTLCLASSPKHRHIVNIANSPASPLRLRPSEATTRVRSSAIRELFALLSREEVISLAGGFPPAVAIDVDALKSAMARTMSQTMPAALLYGSVQGYEPLREMIASRCRGFGTRIDASGIVITSGSQQGIDLIARTMVDPGDAVAVEARRTSAQSRRSRPAARTWSRFRPIAMVFMSMPSKPSSSSTGRSCCT